MTRPVTVLSSRMTTAPESRFVDICVKTSWQRKNASRFWGYSAQRSVILLSFPPFLQFGSPCPALRYRALPPSDTPVDSDMGYTAKSLPVQVMHLPALAGVSYLAVA